MRPLGHPLFFLCLASSNRPKFLAYNSKKKSNDVVKPFFTWNNSFNLKNKHSNSIYSEKQEQKQGHFLQYIVHFVNPNMWMLTFNVILGYQGLLFRDFLWIFFCFFFQSDRPTQYQETHLTLNEKKNRGMVLARIRYCVSLKSGWTTWTLLVIIIVELDIIKKIWRCWWANVQTGLTFPMLTIDLITVLEASCRVGNHVRNGGVCMRI